MNIDPYAFDEALTNYADSIQMIQELTEDFTIEFPELDSEKQSAFIYHSTLAGTVRMLLNPIGYGGTLNVINNTTVREFVPEFREYSPRNEKYMSDIIEKYSSKHRQAMADAAEKTKAREAEAAQENGELLNEEKALKRVKTGEKLKAAGIN